MKKFKIIISAVLVIVLTLSLISCSKNTYEIQNSYDEIYNNKNISLDITAGDEFKILKINDTHFINGTCNDDKKTLDELKTVLDKTPCDLIIVDGDLVEGYNSKLSYNKYKAVSIFAELVENYNVPWTFAPGNNDGQKDGSNQDLIAFMLQYENFIADNEKGIEGTMQFFIDLKQNGELIHSIAILDSHSLDDKGEYDYIKENQIDWLIDGINERKVKTSVFFHMPTPAFETAYKQGTAYNNFPFSDDYSVSDIEKNSLFDEKTENNEYITLLSTAHVHSDNIAYLYNNRYYQLSSLGGYSAAGSKNTAPSFTLTTIHVNEQDVDKLYTFEKVSA